MNDPRYKDFAVIATSEPDCYLINSEVVVPPMTHSNWQLLKPTTFRKDRRHVPIRSYLHIRKDLKAVQIPVDSADITAARIVVAQALTILVVPVYVPSIKRIATDATNQVSDEARLHRRLHLIEEAIASAREVSSDCEIVILGDFNRHDSLWAGSREAKTRQGKAQPIIDFL